MTDLFRNHELKGHNIFAVNNPALLDRTRYSNIDKIIAGFALTIGAEAKYSRRGFFKIAGAGTAAVVAGLSDSGAYAAAPANGNLLFPWAVVGGDYTLLLQLVNNEETPKTGDIAISRIDTAPLEIMANNAATPSSIYDFRLEPNGSFALLAPSSSNSHLRVTPASLLIRPRTGGNNLSATLYYIRNGSGVTVRDAEYGAKRVLPIQQDSQYAPGVAISNNGIRDTDVAFRLYDEKHFLRSEVLLSRLEGSKLRAGEGYGKMLYEIFKGLPSSFVGKLEIEASEPIGATGLRVNLNNFTYSSLRDSAPLIEPRQSVVFPHSANGKGLTLEMILSHHGNQPEDGMLEIFKQPEGTPLLVSVPSIGITTSKIPIHLDPQGVAYIKAFYDGNVTAGSARYLPNNGMSFVKGTLFFPTNNSLTSVQDAEPRLKNRIPVVNGDYDPAVAVYNPNKSDANLVSVLRSSDGKEIISKGLTLGPNQQFAKYLIKNSELFPIAGVTGDVLDVKSDVPVSVVGLGVDKRTGTLIGLESGPYVVIPKIYRAIVNAADVVTLNNIVDGETIIRLGNLEKRAVNGRAEFQIEEGIYEADYTNASVLPQWTLVRKDKNGINLALGDLRGKARIPITQDTELYLIKIPSNFVGDRSVQGNIIRLDDFTWVIDTLKQFADPLNIWERYTNVVNQSDAVLKQRRLSVFDYIQSRSRGKIRILPHEGGPLPASNIIETVVNNKGPSHGESFGGNVISDGLVEFRSDMGSPLPWDGIFEEYFQTLYHLSDPLVGNSAGIRAYVFPVINQSGPIDLTNFGKAVFYTTLEFSRGAKFK